MYNSTSSETVNNSTSSVPKNNSTTLLRNIFPVNWIDFTQHYNTFVSLLKWSDTTQGLLFPSESKPELNKMWLSAVMRSNRVKIFLKHDVYKSWKFVYVYPHLEHVGNTSWTVGFRVTNKTGELLSLIETTMVFTNASHTSSIPISESNKQQMLQMISSNHSNQLLKLGRPTFDPPSQLLQEVDPWQFDTVVRITDCDSLNHINNAQYAVLVEEIRLHGAYLNKYGSNDMLGSLPACELSIAYLGQAHPFETMKITTFKISKQRQSKEKGKKRKMTNEEEEECSYRTDFYIDNEIITQSILTVRKQDNDAKSVKPKL